MPSMIVNTWVCIYENPKWFEVLVRQIRVARSDLKQLAKVVTSSNTDIGCEHTKMRLTFINRKKNIWEPVNVFM